MVLSTRTGHTGISDIGFSFGSNILVARKVFRFSGQMTSRWSNPKGPVPRPSSFSTKATMVLFEPFPECHSPWNTVASGSLGRFAKDGVGLSRPTPSWEGQLVRASWFTLVQGWLTRLSFRRQACNSCHVVEPTNPSPRIIVIGPDFQDIANTKGMTATALRVSLTTSHPKMPNLILCATADRRM